ncbi:MAG: hypothetical protein J5523_02710 [Muribaculaceae bacterium]|nr:hypothetical protein [Muribaculaceae bacterium]
MKNLIKIPDIGQDKSLGNSIGALLNIINQTTHLSLPIVWDFAEMKSLNRFFLGALAIFKNTYSSDLIECINMEKSLCENLEWFCFFHLMHLENKKTEAIQELISPYLNESFLPVCCFSMNDANKNDVEYLLRKVVLCQCGNSELRTPLSYFMSELIDNINEHSCSKNGYFFSEYIKEKRLLNIVIADEGITVKSSFENADLFLNEIDNDESEALRLANEGRSTKNLPEAENRGYGIITTKKMLVDGLGGSFFMLSGGAFHRYEKGINYYANVSDFLHWKGTIVMLRIPIDIPASFNYIDYIENR